MGVLYQPDPENHLAVITIDRPEARNAVNGEVAQGIEEAIDAIEADPDIWVAIVTGTPPAFSAGADLKEVSSGNGHSISTERGGFGGIVKRERSVPFIAAVDGPALAGGLEIVLSCDLVVAGESSIFGLPEVKRSLIAAGGGVMRLARRLPTSIAMEWALTGDYYPASVAYQYGLVNEVVPDGTALDAAKSLAARIAVNAPIAVRLTRDVILETTYLDEDAAWPISEKANEAVWSTNDFHEGPRAFVEKRPPVWTNS